MVGELERGGVAAESGERENFVAETGFGTHCSRGTRLREEESLWRRQCANIHFIASLVHLSTYLNPPSPTTKTPPSPMHLHTQAVTTWLTQSCWIPGKHG